jgi:hypothetical protein
MDIELERLLAAALSRELTDADREEQRINFAYGNAPDSDKNSTKDSVRAASKNIKAS